jgi:GNAT superfamily N-acetyltransferase
MHHPSNLLLLSYLKRTWLPYINSHPDAINHDYYQVLRRFPKADPRSLRGLWDADGTLQAAAAVYFEERPVFLELLLTAPWRKKGSGSSLLLDIVQEANRFGATEAIALNAAPGAIGFYQKYGFVIIRPALKPGWDTPMRLTVPAAQWLLRQQTGVEVT